MDSPISAKEVAQHFSVHVNTVKRISPIELPYFRVGERGDRRYNMKDVLAYISKRTITR